MESEKIKPEYNPESVVKYFSRGATTGRCKDSDLVMSVKSHLSAIGWSFNFVFKAPGKKELRYRSPAGKNFTSLIKACETLVDCNGCYIHDLELGSFKKPTKKSERLCNGVDLGCVKIRNFEKPEKELEKRGQNMHNLDLGGFKKPTKKSEIFGSDVDLGGVKIRNIKKPGKGLEESGQNLELEFREVQELETKLGKYSDDDPDLVGVQIQEFTTELEKELVNCDYNFKEPEGKFEINDNDVDLDIDEFSKELEKQLVNDEAFLSDNRPKKKIRLEDVETSYFSSTIKNKLSEGKKIRDMKRIMDCGYKFKPKKVIRTIESGSGSGSRRRCVPALLIEKGVVLRGSNVSYKKKDGSVIAKGRIYDEGIQCNCCGLFYLLSKFEAHAGSTYHRPAAYLFLDDNRSLFDCQAELNLNLQNKLSKVGKSTKSADSVTGNDEFCLFCKDGGELLLCDSCTSSFHWTCLGLNGVPDSDYWFCPACSCGICHQGGQISKSTTKDQIKCVQCEHYFHINCLKKLGFSVSIDSAKWLCSEKCERINSGLMGILGKPISLPVDNLSWSLLKFENDENDMCRYTESYSKLLVALEVMHECFQPVKHPWSENDLVDDVIFNKSSKRWSLEGFFTAVLEKDEEMITVATVRIHGSKVAEIPLVATRFRYRKLGMCQILMNQLERKLGDLGVERLVLPAVPELISLWTESFGFSVMTKPEQLNVVECKFLEFPGTIKCQKMLKKM